MKYDWIKGNNENEFMAWIILESISRDENKIFEELTKSKDWDVTNIDVELIINSKKVDIEGAFKVIENQIDRMVAEKAGEMIKEKMGESWNNISEMFDSIERYTKRKAKESFGTNIFKEDW